MTENKRFTFTQDTLAKADVFDGDEFVCCTLSVWVEQLVDLLNNLSEDNEYLEKRFKEEEWHYDHIDEDRDVWKHKCQELERENEELNEKIDKLEGMLINNGLM